MEKSLWPMNKIRLERRYYFLALAITIISLSIFIDSACSLYASFANKTIGYKPEDYNLGEKGFEVYQFIVTVTFLSFFLAATYMLKIRRATYIIRLFVFFLLFIIIYIGCEIDFAHIL
jgi:hypothetical protein